MSYQLPGAGAPDALTCHYGVSKLRFRGPGRDITAPYLACIGGSETFGRFVAAPYPALLETRMGEACINLGSVNSGLDALLHDPELSRIATGADACIVQLPSAHNLSNRLYRVHPRRNDRFLEASRALADLYQEVDFTDFHFNKHMLGRLYSISPDRFASVRAELQQAWSARMRRLIAAFGGRVVLLWLRYLHMRPDDPAEALGAEPLMVTPEMVAALAPDALCTVEIPVQMAGQSDELDDMIFGMLQEPAAEHMIGPATHRIIADRVFRALQDLDT
ncbi:DUF6473 family protein [Ruegeria marina]|uniref:DUF6473 domain-containing protein n=1 Tax=Ruegeria marina TaxID=639004 RepID=A0A1G7BM03_9RHOB|nr:DUF6473 family protein [Ruegeria marina]SDE28138.1 hypothetical protein SAMN04488239_116139 [Ruegeria marina]